MPTGPHIVIATGGSGGHLYPAFAVADEIERRWSDAHVRLTIGNRPIEREICESAGRNAQSLQLVPTSEAFRHPLRFLTAFSSAKRKALALFGDAKPDCVVGTGGFTMAPVLQAAMNERIPVVLLEQNALPGRATKWFARRAAAVCTSFGLTPLKLPTVHHTGNPVRGPIARLVSQPRPERGTILIVGGSQGARALNQALACIAKHQTAVLAGRSLVHQTGGIESARELEDVYRNAGIKARVAPYFDDMAPLYAEASLLIGRAGASTLAEAACAGLPAILIPYPHAADLHQHANAIECEVAGAAWVFGQSDEPLVNGRSIAGAVETFFSNGHLRAEMSRKMLELARPDASRHVVDIIATTFNSSP